MKAVCTEKGAVIGAVAMNADITELEEALERSRLLANRLIKVQEEERGRISRELHDTIIQHLSAPADEAENCRDRTARESRNMPANCSNDRWKG
jgi:signal transduction histidine kinase